MDALRWMIRELRSEPGRLMAAQTVKEGMAVCALCMCIIVAIGAWLS